MATMTDQKIGQNEKNCHYNRSKNLDWNKKIGHYEIQGFPPPPPPPPVSHDSRESWVVGFWLAVKKTTHENDSWKQLTKTTNANESWTVLFMSRFRESRLTWVVGLAAGGGGGRGQKVKPWWNLFWMGLHKPEIDISGKTKVQTFLIILFFENFWGRRIFYVKWGLTWFFLSITVFCWQTYTKKKKTVTIRW